tara:strand:- start:1642 stop:2607 length:966 start_codon:yes stop_codon:yes gene_type:complete
MPSLAKRIRYFFEWLALATTFWLIPLTPRWILRKIASGLGLLGFYVHRDGRRTAFENLEAAFPGRWTEDEIEQIVLKCYRSWAQTYLDQFWTRRLNSEIGAQLITYPTLDEVRELSKTGGILMTPHYGNFEWMAAGLGLHGLQYTAIAQDFKNPRLTGIFKKNREFLGHQLIPQERAMLKLLRVLKKGGISAFLPDLTVPPGDTATIIKMFGMKVSVTVLGAFLSKRTGLPVMTGACMPMRDGSYFAMSEKMIRFKPEQSEQEIAQQCWDSVERIINQRPEHYLWMYKHFRFRPKEGGERYPSYANRSKKFDRLEERLSEA